MTEAADDQPSIIAYRGMQAIRFYAGRLLALPLWLLVGGAGVCVAAAYVVPVSFTTDARLNQLVNTLVFAARVMQFHIGLMAAVLMPIAWLVMRRRLAIVSLLVAATLLGAELYRAAPTPSRPQPQGERLRVLAINLYYFNGDLDAIESYIREVEPDVISFSEFGRIHHPLLERMADIMPHQAWPKMSQINRVLVMADRPMVQQDVGFGRGAATIDFGGRPLVISGVHHQSPGGVKSVTKNYRQLASLLDELSAYQAAGAEVVTLGDFNASTWTPQLAALRDAGLTEVHDATSWGRGTTWPNTFKRRSGVGSFVDRSGLGVRIDNIFTTSGLVASQSGIGESVGSDHRPIWADLYRTTP